MSFNKPRGLKNPGVKISGTGSYLPGNPIYNQELIDRFSLNTSDEKIKTNLGIVKRHYAGEGVGASILGYEASKIALENAKIGAKELDRIIFCSSSSDWTSPASACNIQALLGADCPAEDKQTACSSFIFGLEHGARLIATGMENVLVIGSDVKSKFTRPDDPKFLPIFADGAGAVVLNKCEPSSGLLLCELWSDGRMLNNLITPAGGSAMPASENTIKNNLHAVQMNVDGKVIFNDAVHAMTELSKQVCFEMGISTNEIDLFIPHQANLLIMKEVAKNLNIPLEKTIITINETANIVSGTIPYSLDFAYRNNRILKGMNILMVTAGAGYSAGAALYKEL